MLLSNYRVTKVLKIKKEVENEIDIANNRDIIQHKPLIKKLSLLSLPYDFEKGLNALTYTIESISQDYISLIEHRKAALSSVADPEAWLETGFRNIKEDKCPFCEQEIPSNLSIIRSYTQYFDNTYRRLKEVISTMTIAFDKYSTALTPNQKIILNNVNDLIFWKTYLTDYVLDHEDLSEEMLRIRDISLPAVLKELHQKASNLTDYDKVTEFLSFKEFIHKINNLIASYNNQVDIINTKISLIKNEKGLSLTEIQQKRSILLITQLRGTEECKTICQDLSDLQNIIKANNKQMKSLKELLEAYIAETFDKYSEKINIYLARFAPYIRIQALNHKYRGTSTDPYVTYGLFVHENAVQFQDNSDAPSIKYSLSEGDKSALAFCFFLAKLAVDTNLSNKVVIFDDPISSFDIGRKATTVRMLMEISKLSKQLIVLSHNIFFAYDFLEAVNQRSELGPCVTLRIAHGDNTSIFKQHKIDQEVLFSFLKDYNILSDFVEKGEPDESKRRQIGKCIRTVLEGYFRVKFFRELGRGQWLGNALEKIRDAADESNAFFRLKSLLSELEDINDYSKGFHHASTDITESESINEEELKGYSRRTIAVAQLI